MNKKGFTLVEILAVIVILSLVITIIATRGFGAFNNTKEKIEKQDIEAIEESGKIFMTDVQYCDDETLDEELKQLISENFHIEGTIDCKKLQEYFSEGTKEIPLDFLKESKYIEGTNISNESFYNNDTIIISGKIYTDKVVVDVKYDSNSEQPILANKIIFNSKRVSPSEETNGIAIYRENPTTKVGEDASLISEASLSKVNTNNGYSYYYRGNVKNNYVNFANMCWRIVRILENGSIKLILEDKNALCNSSDYTGNWVTGSGSFGYDNTTYPGKVVENYLNSNSGMANNFKNFQQTKLESYSSYLENSGWCFNNIAYASKVVTDLTSSQLSNIIKINKYTNNINFYYDSLVRLYGNGDDHDIITPALKCPSNAITMYNWSDNIPMLVGTLTVDELVYAGAKVYSSNPNYFLKAPNSWMTLSLDSFYNSRDNIFTVRNNGTLYGYLAVNENNNYRPAIVLKSTTKMVSGNGLINNPYEVLTS